MTKTQIENLGIKQVVYCKRHLGRPLTRWTVTHIFQDCVWVEALIPHYTGKPYLARRVVYLRRLEHDWEIW